MVVASPLHNPRRRLLFLPSVGICSASPSIFFFTSWPLRRPLGSVFYLITFGAFRRLDVAQVACHRRRRRKEKVLKKNKKKEEYSLFVQLDNIGILLCLSTSISLSFDTLAYIYFWYALFFSLPGYRALN